MNSAYTPRTPCIEMLAAATHGEYRQPRRGAPHRAMVLGAMGVAVALVSACGSDSDNSAAEQAALVEQGKQIFRYDTFGDETQWTDTLRMHEVIRMSVDPTTALSVGLKVDSEALPAAVVTGIQNGSVDLRSPATTVALLKLNAVVGLNTTPASTWTARTARRSFRPPTAWRASTKSPRPEMATTWRTGTAMWV